MSDHRMFGLRPKGDKGPWHLAQDGRLAWCGVQAQFRHVWWSAEDTSSVTCVKCLKAIAAGQPRAWRS